MTASALTPDERKAWATKRRDGYSVEIPMGDLDLGVAVTKRQNIP